MSGDDEETAEDARHRQAVHDLLRLLQRRAVSEQLDVVCLLAFTIAMSTRLLAQPLNAPELAMAVLAGQMAEIGRLRPDIVEVRNLCRDDDDGDEEVRH